MEKLTPNDYLPLLANGKNLHLMAPLETTLNYEYPYWGVEKDNGKWPLSRKLTPIEWLMEKTPNGAIDSENTQKGNSAC